METFVTIMIGVCLGWAFKAFHAEYKLQKDIAEAELDAEESAKTNKPRDFLAYMKEDSGIYYLYDRATDMFLAQGRTAEEIADKLADRFPGSKVWMTEQNSKDVGFKK